MKLALTPLNSTDVAPVNAVPVIATDVPTLPVAGVKLITLGSTLKFVELVPVPEDVVTAT